MTDKRFPKVWDNPKLDELKVVFNQFAVKMQENLNADGSPNPINAFDMTVAVDNDEYPLASACFIAPQAAYDFMVTRCPSLGKGTR